MNTVTCLHKWLSSTSLRVSGECSTRFYLLRHLGNARSFRDEFRGIALSYASNGTLELKFSQHTHSTIADIKPWSHTFNKYFIEMHNVIQSLCMYTGGTFDFFNVPGKSADPSEQLQRTIGLPKPLKKEQTPSFAKRPWLQTRRLSCDAAHCAQFSQRAR